MFPLLPTCWGHMGQIVHGNINNKKHLKNVGPIRHCEPPHTHSPGVACASMSTMTPDNDDDNAWQTGPLWPHGMGPIKAVVYSHCPMGTYLAAIHQLMIIVEWWYTCRNVTWLFFLRRMKNTCQPTAIINHSNYIRCVRKKTRPPNMFR